LFIGTSTITPRLGQIYKLNIGLESLLEQLGLGRTIFETDSSSSSSISKSSYVSSQKQQEKQSKGKGRPYLIWRIKENGIKV
jgi:hypothetical protein